MFEGTYYDPYMVAFPRHTGDAAVRVKWAGLITREKHNDIPEGRLVGFWKAEGWIEPGQSFDVRVPRDPGCLCDVALFKKSPAIFGTRTTEADLHTLEARYPGYERGRIGGVQPAPRLLALSVPPGAAVTWPAEPRGTLLVLSEVERMAVEHAVLVLSGVVPEKTKPELAGPLLGVLKRLL